MTENNFLSQQQRISLLSVWVVAYLQLWRQLKARLGLNFAMKQPNMSTLFKGHVQLSKNREKNRQVVPLYTLQNHLK